MGSEASPAELALPGLSGKQGRVEGVGRGRAQPERGAAGPELGFKLGTLDLAVLSGSRSARREGSGFVLHVDLKENCFVLVHRRRKQTALIQPHLCSELQEMTPSQGTKGTRQGWDSFCCGMAFPGAPGGPR